MKAMNMKKKIFVISAVAVVVLTFAACKKSRFCYCTTKEGEPDTLVVNVDRSMKCDHIVELGVERLQDGVPVVTTQKVSCKELDTDTTVITIPF